MSNKVILEQIQIIWNYLKEYMHYIINKTKKIFNDHLSTSQKLTELYVRL